MSIFINRMTYKNSEYLEVSTDQDQVTEKQLEEAFYMAGYRIEKHPLPHRSVSGYWWYVYAPDGLCFHDSDDVFANIVSRFNRGLRLYRGYALHLLQFTLDDGYGEDPFDDADTDD